MITTITIIDVGVNKCVCHFPETSSSFRNLESLNQSKKEHPVEAWLEMTDMTVAAHHPNLQLPRPREVGYRAPNSGT